MNNKLIAITKIENEDIKQAVFKSLELINADRLFAKPNLKILLKPNILMGKAPEKAVNTHPEVIRAIVQWLKRFNPQRIIVGESSGTRSRGATETAFKESGIQKICEEENIEYTSFEKTPRKIYNVRNPLILKEFPASTLLNEVDLIINIPKIKTHSQCILTCCIKNMFGTLILGQKSSTHAKFPRYDDFSSALVDIYSVSKPQLTIIDGYYCQEGNGPTAGDVVKLNLIIAGYDPVALENVVCKIIEFESKEILYISKAEAKGLGISDLNKCEIVGVPIDSVKRKFKKPRILPVAPLPKILGKYVGKILFRTYIKFDVSKCKLCSTCWNNCPVQAIDPPKELRPGYTVPKWNKSKCITCYCCAELCPYEAVNFKINVIRNILSSWLLALLIILFLVGIGVIWVILKIFNTFL